MLISILSSMLLNALNRDKAGAGEDSGPPKEGKAGATTGGNTDDLDDDDSDDQEPEVVVKNPGALWAKHQKLKKEMSKMQKALEERDRSEEEKRKKLLEENQDFKTLYEQEKKAREAAEAKGKESAEHLLYLRKVAAFKQALGEGVELPQKYVVLIDFDEIGTDDDTGEINQADLLKAAKQFKKEYPEVIKAKGSKGNGLPTDAPGENNLKPLTEEEYNAMSLKDKKANLKRFNESLKQRRA